MGVHADRAGGAVMETWQVMLLLLVATGTLILGRQWGYDDAWQRISELINKASDLAMDEGISVRIGQRKDDEE